jgi:hypothetical protein
MDVLFDSTALKILRMMGYRYFCNREIALPEPDPNDGMCAYWEITPFKTKASALKSYLSLRNANSNNRIWWEDEHLEELSCGLFGLIVYLNLTDDVFS